MLSFSFTVFMVVLRSNMWIIILFVTFGFRGKRNNGIQIYNENVFATNVTFNSVDH